MSTLIARGMLVICTGGFEGMEYPLSEDETIIGRNPTTNITLLDEGISREHALILYDDWSGDAFFDSARHVRAQLTNKGFAVTMVAA